jgi:SAM-dependent methyltransferase
VNGNPHRFQGSIRHVAANWPAYALAGGGLILSLVLIAVLATRNWLAFIPMTLAALIVLLYYLSTALWTAHMLYDENGLNPHHVLFDMGRIESDDSFAFIDLGRRQAATELSHRLTSGKILVVDVYSPQWTPSRALARERTNAMLPASDPRVEWYAGDINLLPLPDRSVSAVVICHVLSQFWQRGDQLVLLKEIHRILAPDGRMLLAERTRTEINWLLMGPLALRLPRAESWRDLVARSGFLVKEERSLQGLTHCFRADRNQPEGARQLAFKLGF